MSRKVGSIVLVLVLALCTAGAAQARPLDRKAEAGGGGFLEAMSRLLDWVGRVADGSTLIFIQGWEGSHLDPNGNPIP